MSEMYGKPRLTDSVRSCTRPASAKVWPAFISTAVSTSRTVKRGNADATVPGITTPWLSSILADSRANFEPDIAVAEHDRQEVDLRAERFELDRGRAQALRHDDRELRHRR